MLVIHPDELRLVHQSCSTKRSRSSLHWKPAPDRRLRLDLKHSLDLDLDPDLYLNLALTMKQILNLRLNRLHSLELDLHH